MSSLPPSGNRDRATFAALAAGAAPAAGAPPRWPDETGQLLRVLTVGLGRVFDRPRGGEDPVVDHIVLSPAGVDVVQVRPVHGRVAIRRAGPAHHERALYVDMQDRTAWLSDLDATLAEVRDALGRSPLARVRRGWLCLDGADWHEMPSGMHLGGYPVLPPSLLRQFLPLTGPFRAAHIALGAERVQHKLATTRPRPRRAVSA